MMHRIAVSFLLLSFALGSAFASDNPSKETDNPWVVVIRDLTIILPERDAPLPHATVVIRDGRITQVGSAL